MNRRTEKLRRVHVLMLAGISVVSGCAGATALTDEAPPVELSEQWTRVSFVTTREIETQQSRSFYGDGRGSLTAGTCDVLFKNPEAPKAGARVEAITRTEEPAVHTLADPVIYVHGYNIDLEKGCRQSGILQRRAALENRLLLYSWPSEGSVFDYIGDVADLEWSVPHLARYLDTLAQAHDPETIDLIGHSLGARGLVAALVRLVATHPQPPRFGHLVLTAPDIDRDLFAWDLEAILSATTGVTVYVSGNDRALRVSEETNGYLRLGQPGSVVPGADVVDVTGVGTRTPSGHVYHIYNPAVIADLRRVLGTGQPASGGSRRVRNDSAPGWVLVPVE